MIKWIVHRWLLHRAEELSSKLADLESDLNSIRSGDESKYTEVYAKYNETRHLYGSVITIITSME